MSFGLQCFDASGLLTFDTSLPVFKLISKTTHTIPPSGLMRDLTLAAPGASSAANIKIATVYSLPLSQRVTAQYDHEAFLRSINTNSVSYKFYNPVSATFNYLRFSIMSYGLETFYSDGGGANIARLFVFKSLQKGFITTASTLPGTLLTLPAGYESPLPVFRGNYANACFESQNQLRLFAPYDTDYKLLAPVPFPERSGYGIQARNASNQIYFDNEGDYFSVDAVFNLRRTVVYDGIDRIWFNIPLAAPPNGRLRYASLNFFEAGRGYASGAPQAQVAPLLINVTNTNINLKYAFNSMLGFAAPGWSGTSDWDGFDADIYIVTGY